MSDLPENDRPELSPLEERLGHRFREPRLLVTALTHPSWRGNAPDEEVESNQRREYLGDAGLGAVVADYLVERHADCSEGRLTKVRSRLVNEASLGQVARRLELGRWLRVSPGERQAGGLERRAVLADALEAVIGAMWRDGGFEAVRRFFADAFAEQIAEAIAAGDEDNPKGELQEWTQGNWQEVPRYELLEESGPPHDRQFRMGVFLDGELVGMGRGATKREAEQQAARKALEFIRANDRRKE